jgi:ATP-dependent DNA ligase
VFLYAFDLIELNGDDLRRDPLEGRKATLEMMLAKAGPRIRFNEHMEGDGPTVFANACKTGIEGIVSKRKDSAYRSGRSPDWLKMKNAAAPAVKCEADCMNHISRQREIITTEYEQGLPTEIAESMLRPLEESLRALEKHRQFIVDRFKDAERS